MYYEAFFNETGPGVGPIPWTHKRGPAYWDGRLREHYSARGVNVTEDYLKVRSVLGLHLRAIQVLRCVKGLPVAV